MEQDRRYLRTQMQKENIIQKLKERGCRITKQRLMLLDIILEEDCSCCKEIYYNGDRLPHGEYARGDRSHQQKEYVPHYLRSGLRDGKCMYDRI